MSADPVSLDEVMLPSSPETDRASVSSPLPLIHHRDEVTEQIERVVRPRRGLRMVLNSHGRLAAMAEPLQSLIVEIDVGVLDVVLTERVRIDGESVILRGDLHPAGAQILHRMVAAAMSEFQFVR